MAAPARQIRPADRRRHRHGHRHLARRGQGRQLGEADRGPIRHPHHHTLSDRRPEDHHGRHGRLLHRRAELSTDLSDRLADARSRRSRRAVRHWPQAAIFPARCSLRSRRSRSNGRSATSSARAIGKRAVDYDDDPEHAGGGKFTDIHHRFLFGSVAEKLADTFGTKGSPISLSTACASGATSIQLGVEAIRRGETDAALCVATDGSVNREALVRFSLLSALSTQNDPPQSALKAVLEEPRRICHGGRRRRAGAGEPMKPRRRAARPSSA